VGFLDAVTLREEARFRTTAGVDGRATVEPRANYFTARVKRDLRLGNTTIGAALNTVHRDLGDEELAPMFRSAAYVGGVDWQHAWHDRRWAFDGAVVLSSNHGSAEAIDQLQLSPARYYQRPDREGYFRDSSRTSLTGYVAEMTLAKLSGKWRATLTYQDYSPGFEVNESGFIGSTDMRGLASLVGYIDNAPKRQVRNWGQYLFWNPSWNYDGDVTFNGVGAITYAELPNFWNVQLRLDWRPPVIDDRLTRGGPNAGLTTGYAVRADIDSDRRKRLTYGLTTSRSWNAAGGWGITLNPRASLRPSSAVRVSLQPSYSRTHAMAQYVTRVADPLASDTHGARYVFATLDQHQLALVTRLDWTFTPELSLQLFAQPLLAGNDFTDYKEFARPREFAFEVYGRDAGTIARSEAGLYTVDPDGAGAAAPFSFNERDFNQRSLRGNAVVRWEYRPGSALFLVWQQRRFEQVRSGEFGPGHDLGELWGTKPENVFVVKGTWWVGR
ncbi:MAG TPA: DUF5916 domain-containing protein, partial [Gemmatimonadaceae bacterium]|nr:DUF5916 domain-containing protein [Gemmatimonadaceae bacterium]